MRVDICIASLGRPSLLALLRRLEACELPRDCAIAVRIADDSPDGAAARLVSSRSWPFPIACIAVGSRNISKARNAAVAGADGDFVAFIDDDEVPNTDWLMRLVETAAATGADAVVGSVIGVLPEGTAAWLKAAAPFDRRPGRSGQRLQTGATSNALVRTATIRRLRLSFDEALGRTGGEDTDFFFRLSAAGGVIVACDEAVVSEAVPPERLVGDHLRTRYMRGGYSHARSSLAGTGPLRRSAFAARSAAKLLVASAVAPALRLVREDLAMRFATRSWTAFGELLFVARRASPQPYQAPNG